MHMGMCSGFAAGKIFTALLLGAVLIAMQVPAGDVAFSQTGTGTDAGAPAQIPSFIAVDLNPDGFIESWATGASGGQQVGYGYGPATGGYGHALLWRGTAASVVDLHPRGFMISRALGISGGHQVGVGLSPQPMEGSHALLWHGSTSSVVDLHPHGFVRSEASGVSGGQQVGWGSAIGGKKHALLWNASAADVVDLHPRGLDESEAVGTSGGQQVGWGTTCVEGQGCHRHALLWLGTVNSAVDLGEGEAYGTSGEHQVGSGAHGNAVVWTGSAESTVDLAPVWFYNSTASGISSAEQVGYGGPWTQTHALLWRGNVQSLVDLHAYLPPGFAGSTATGLDSNGDVVGVAWGPASGNRTHAFLWTRNAKAKLSAARPVDKFTTLYSQRIPSAFGVYTASPAEFFLTDPLGNQSGFDPITKVATSEYEVSVMCDESPGGTGGCKPPFKQLNRGSSMDGRYTLDVIGTGTGDFDVEVRISDDAGNWISQSYSGMTTPGHISRFSFFGKLIAFAAFNATITVNAASKSLEVDGTFILGPGGAISPVTQPVTVWTDSPQHSFYATIPAGSFKKTQQGAFVFEGVIHGDQIAAELVPTDGTSYTFRIRAAVQDLSNLPEDHPNDNSVDVQLAIGNNGERISIKPNFGPKP